MTPRPTHPACGRVLAQVLALCAPALLLGAAPALAQDAAHRIGGASFINRGPLQELLQKRPAPGGSIFVAIPQMSRRGDNTVYRPFCIPRITVVNSSPETVEELIVGVRYTDSGAKPVGSTVSRFMRLKSLREDDDESYHDHLKAANCDDLVGEVEVLRCVYDSGQDCSGNVRALGYGAVRLQLAAPTAAAAAAAAIAARLRSLVPGALPPASAPGGLPPLLVPKEKR